MEGLLGYTLYGFGIMLFFSMIYEQFESRRRDRKTYRAQLFFQLKYFLKNKWKYLQLLLKILFTPLAQFKQAIGRVLQTRHYLVVADTKATPFALGAMEANLLGLYICIVHVAVAMRLVNGSFPDLQELLVRAIALAGLYIFIVVVFYWIYALKTPEHDRLVMRDKFLLPGWQQSISFVK